MTNIFPSDVGVTQVRGFVKIIREHGGAMEMAQLAEETGEDIDKLLPIIKALKMLGIVTTKKDLVMLTKEEAHAKSIHQYAASKLPSIEPFKGLIQALRISPERTLNTDSLIYTLSGNGIRVAEPELANRETLKKMLLHWCIRSKILKYNSKEDLWTLTKAD